MAITIASLGTLGNTGNVASYGTTPIRAPAANATVLVGVVVSDTAGTPVEPTQVRGAGLTFSLVTSSVTWATVASPTANLSVWVGKGAAPDTSNFTADFPNAATGCAFIIHEVSGLTTVGSGISKSATSRNPAGTSASTLTIFAPSAGSTANAWLTFCATEGDSGNISPNLNLNWTALDVGTYSTPATRIESAWTTLSTGNTSSWTKEVASFLAAIQIELVADNPAAAGGVISPYYASYYQPRVVCG